MSNGQKPRRTWTAQEKLRIVLAGMESGVEIAELCRREGVAPGQFYKWKKQLLSGAGQVFNERSEKPSKKTAKLQADLERYKQVIAEITAENLELKKTLSG